MSSNVQYNFAVVMFQVLLRVADKNVLTHLARSTSQRTETSCVEVLYKNPY